MVKSIFGGWTVGFPARWLRGMAVLALSVSSVAAFAGTPVPLTVEATAGTGSYNLSANPITLLVDSTPTGALANIKTTGIVSGNQKANPGVDNYINLSVFYDFTGADTALAAAGYSASKYQTLQITVSGGSAADAYVLGSDGANTFDGSTSGFFGTPTSPGGFKASPDPINYSTPVFFATAPGTYTVTFKIYQFDTPTIPSSDPTAAIWSTGTVIAEGSITITVVATAALLNGTTTTATAVPALGMPELLALALLTLLIGGVGYELQRKRG